jgi:hypothetical protein
MKKSLRNFIVKRPVFLERNKNHSDFNNKKVNKKKKKRRVMQ